MAQEIVLPIGGRAAGRQGGRAAGRQRAAGEKSAAPFFFLPFTFVVEADADTDRVLALRETNCLRIMH